MSKSPAQVSDREINVGDRFRVPPWKWMPAKTLTVIYRKGKYVVVDIDGEERPDVGEISLTDDWESVDE